MRIGARKEEGRVTRENIDEGMAQQTVWQDLGAGSGRLRSCQVCLVMWAGRLGPDPVGSGEPLLDSVEAGSKGDVRKVKEEMGWEKEPEAGAVI